MSRMTSPTPSKVSISSFSGRLSLTSSATGKISSEPWFGPGRRGRVRERQLALGGDVGADLERVGALALDELVLRCRACRRPCSRSPTAAASSVSFSITMNTPRYSVPGGGGGWPTRYSAVLGVVGVEEAGDLDVVFEPRDLDRLALDDLGFLLLAAGGERRPARTSAASGEGGDEWRSGRRMAGASILTKARLARERGQPFAAGDGDPFDRRALLGDRPQAPQGALPVAAQAAARAQLAEPVEQRSRARSRR